MQEPLHSFVLTSPPQNTQTVTEGSVGPESLPSSTCNRYGSPPYYCSLYSCTVQHPIDWRTGKIILIFKKGNKCFPLNHRPISLTSVPSKIIGHIIYSNVARFLESNSLFNHHQHGFRKGFLCEFQLVTFVHDIRFNFLFCFAFSRAVWETWC